MLDAGIYDMQQFKESGWLTDLKYEDEINDMLKPKTGEWPTGRGRGAGRGLDSSQGYSASLSCRCSSKARCPGCLVCAKLSGEGVLSPGLFSVVHIILTLKPSLAADLKRRGAAECSNFSRHATLALRVSRCVRIMLWLGAGGKEEEVAKVALKRYASVNPKAFGASLSGSKVVAIIRAAGVPAFPLTLPLGCCACFACQDVSVLPSKQPFVSRWTEQFGLVRAGQGSGALRCGALGAVQCVC
jgi:hypothetical protein